MKKLFVTLAIASLTVGAFAQGKITFQNTAGKGKEKRIYGVNASNPMAQAQGDAADYSGRPQLTGAQYSAELVLSTDGGATVRSLGTFAFRAAGSDGTAGIIAGNSGLVVEGLKGGIKVSVAIRVWDNSGGIDAWSKITDNTARGMSKWVANYELSGVKEDGSPTLGSGNLASAGLESFGLYIVPEPSVVALGALGLGALLLRRRK